MPTARAGALALALGAAGVVSALATPRAARAAERTDAIAQGLRDAEAQLRVGNRAEAERLARVALAELQRAPVAPVDRAWVAAILREAGQPEEARRLAEALAAELDGAPELCASAPGALDLAQARAAAGRPLETIRQAIEQAFTADPALRAQCATRRVADAARRAGRPEDAATLYEETLARGCAERDTWLALTRLYAETERLDDERRVMAAAAARFPDDTEILYRTGDLALRASEFSRAREIWTRVAERDPKYPNLLGPLGAATIMDVAHHAEQRDVLSARLARNPDDAIAHYLLGMLSYYTGALDACHEHMTRAIALRGDEPRMYIYLAMSHYWSARPVEAERAIERAIEVGPNDPDVYYCRSIIRRQKDLAGARADLERYLAMQELPGHYQYPGKNARVRRDLDAMLAGQIPPPPPRPGSKESGNWDAAGTPPIADATHAAGSGAGAGAGAASAGGSTTAGGSTSAGGSTTAGGPAGHGGGCSGCVASGDAPRADAAASLALLATALAAHTARRRRSPRRAMNASARPTRRPDVRA